MATGRASLLVNYLRKISAYRCATDLTDSQLLERFVTQQDQAAFAALVQRHGPMVLAVCRRILRDWQDAEDAFQATFLVFVRKAASLAKPDLLGNWLYGVACRTARKARGVTVRRREHERPMPDSVPLAASCQCHPQDVLWRDLRQVLDEEINRLPEKYRLPLIFCYLEGQTHSEVAKRLCCPKGTVAIRLMRARERLRTRLVRRGLALSAGALATILSQNAAPAAVPGVLVESTIKAAMWVAAGKAVAAGMISEQTLNLMEGVLNAMFLTKVKMVAAVLLVVGVVGAGLGLCTYRPLAAEPIDRRKAEVSRPANDGGDELKPIDRKKEEVSKPGSNGDELKALVKLQTQRLLGTWEREVAGYHLTLTMEAERLSGTFTGRKDGNGEKMNIAIEADYSMTKDSVLYGVLTGVELPDNADGEAELNLLIDQPFSVHFRVNNNVLTLKDVKFMDNGEKNGGNNEIPAIIQGRYKKKQMASK